MAELNCCFRVRSYDCSLSRKTSQWQHFCLTWDEATGDTSGYLGGRLACSKDSFQDRKGPIRGGGKFYIGQLQDGYDKGFETKDTFTGHITGFYLWPSVLKASDIQQMSKSCHFVISLENTIIKWDQLVQSRSGAVFVDTSNTCT